MCTIAANPSTGTQLITVRSLSLCTGSSGPRNRPTESGTDARESITIRATSRSNPDLDAMWTPDKGITASVAAPFFIAVSILMAKIAGEHAHGLFVAGLGSLLSVPILLLVASLTARDLALGALWKRARGAFVRVLVSRAIIGQALIVMGFTMTSAVKSILLLRLEPVFVLLWSVLLLQERPTRGKCLLLSFLLLGSLLVVWPADQVSAPNFGDALILLSLLFLSYSYIPTTRVVEQVPPDGLNLATNLIGGVTLTALALVCYGWSAIPVGFEAWAPIACYSVSFFVIGATLYFYAFRTVKPWIIASFLSLEVVWGLILAFLLLAENLTPLQLCGTGILLATTLSIALYRKHEETARLLQEGAKIG